MARQTDDKNQVWYKKEGTAITIGFTKDFLTSLDQCWHILPASLEQFKPKAPLLTVETTDALISIMSPVAGNFMQFSQRAQNFPDKLTEDDVVLELREGPFVRPTVAPRRIVDMGDFVGGGIVGHRGAAGLAPAQVTIAQAGERAERRVVGDLRWAVNPPIDELLDRLQPAQPRRAILPDYDTEEGL